MPISSKLITIVITAVSGLLLGGCYSYYSEPQDTPELLETYTLERKIENLVYTGTDWPQPLQADLYLPLRRGSLPVVLMVHGGGWANRSRQDMNAVSNKLVQHGYAVMNVSYRFAPRFTYPAQLLDLQQALRWITKNATAYNLDVERINTWGYSSGAHLAALLGAYGGTAGEIPAAIDLPRIRSVVAGGIPADLRKYSGSPIVMRFMGGDRHEMPRRYADASPAYHVSSDDPPVFLYHGKLDSLVADDQAIDYYDALRAAGVNAELYLHGWHGHLTMFQFGGDAEDKAIGFLNRNNSISSLQAWRQN